MAEPISKDGTGRRAADNYATRADPKGWDPEIFTRSTIVLEGGWAEWELEVPEHVRKRLLDMTLSVETVRTHGMLHSPHPGKGARIWLNGDLVDDIALVRPHAHGEDFGVDSRRPFWVLHYIRREHSRQTIRVELEAGTLWDIDRVTLQPIIVSKEIRPEVMMIIGAIVSAVVGAVVRLVT